MIFFSFDTEVEVIERSDVNGVFNFVVEQNKPSGAGSSFSRVQNTRNRPREK